MHFYLTSVKTTRSHFARRRRAKRRKAPRALRANRKILGLLAVRLAGFLEKTHLAPTTQGTCTARKPYINCAATRATAFSSTQSRRRRHTTAVRQLRVSLGAQLRDITAMHSPACALSCHCMIASHAHTVREHMASRAVFEASRSHLNRVQEVVVGLKSSRDADRIAQPAAVDRLAPPGELRCPCCLRTKTFVRLAGMPTDLAQCRSIISRSRQDPQSECTHLSGKVQSPQLRAHPHPPRWPHQPPRGAIAHSR